MTVQFGMIAMELKVAWEMSVKWVGQENLINGIYLEFLKTFLVRMHIGSFNIQNTMKVAISRDFTQSAHP